MTVIGKGYVGLNITFKQVSSSVGMMAFKSKLLKNGSSLSNSEAFQKPVELGWVRVNAT